MPTVHYSSRSFLIQLGVRDPPKTVDEIKSKFVRDPNYFRFPPSLPTNNNSNDAFVGAAVIDNDQVVRQSDDTTDKNAVSPSKTPQRKRKERSPTSVDDAQEQCRLDHLPTANEGGFDIPIAERLKLRREKRKINPLVVEKKGNDAIKGGMSTMQSSINTRNRKSTLLDSGSNNNNEKGNDMGGNAKVHQYTPRQKGGIPPGLSQASSGKWRVNVGYQSKKCYFGSFDTFEQASLVNKMVRGKLTAEIGTKLSKKEVDLNINLAYEAVEQIINGRNENGSAVASGSNQSSSSRKVATESENDGKEIDNSSNGDDAMEKARTDRKEVRMAYQGKRRYIGVFYGHDQAERASEAAKEIFDATQYSILTAKQIQRNVELAKEAAWKAVSVTNDDDDYDDGDSNYIDPLLKEPYLTNIRIKVDMTSWEIVGVTGDSLVASESGRKLDRDTRQAKKGSNSNRSRSDFGTVGVYQLPSGNWQVRIGYHGKWRVIGTFDCQDKATCANESARGVLEATKGLTLTDEEVKLNVTQAKEAALEAIRRMSVESSASKRPAIERPPKKARKSSLPAGVRQTACESWTVQFRYQRKQRTIGTYARQDQATLANKVAREMLMPTNKSSLTVEEIQQNVELAKEAARRAVCSSVRSRRAVRDNSERGAGCDPNLAIGRWQNDKLFGSWLDGRKSTWKHQRWKKCHPQLPVSDQAVLFASQYSMGQETGHNEHLSLASKCSSEEIITHSILEHSTSNSNPSEEEEDAIVSLLSISGKSSKAERKESNDGNAKTPDVEVEEAITTTRNAQWEYAIDADGLSTFEALWKKRAATDADQPQYHFYNGKNNTDMINLRALSKQGLEKESELSRNIESTATTTKPTYPGYLHYSKKEPWQVTIEDKFEKQCDIFREFIVLRGRFPKRTEDTDSLENKSAQWMSKQRTYNLSGKMRPDRKVMLDDIHPGILDDNFGFGYVVNQTSLTGVQTPPGNLNNPAVESKAELSNQDEEKRMMEVKEMEKERKDDEESRALVRLSSLKDDDSAVSSHAENTPVKLDDRIPSNGKLPATQTVVELRSVSAVKPSEDESLGLCLERVGEEYIDIQVTSIAPTSIFSKTALRVGDVVHSINGLTYNSFEEGVSWLKATPGRLALIVASPPSEGRLGLQKDSELSRNSKSAASSIQQVVLPKRLTFTALEKLHIIDEVERSNDAQAVLQKYGTQPRSVQRWKLDQSKLEKEVAEGSTSKRTIRTDPLRHIKEIVANYISANKATMRVTGECIKTRALLAKDHLLQQHAQQPFLSDVEVNAMMSFKAANRWCNEQQKVAFGDSKQHFGR